MFIEDIKASYWQIRTKWAQILPDQKFYDNLRLVMNYNTLSMLKKCSYPHELCLVKHEHIPASYTFNGTPIIEVNFKNKEVFFEFQLVL